jgi:uracil-DNA glycosylase
MAHVLPAVEAPCFNIRQPGWQQVLEPWFTSFIGQALYKQVSHKYETEAVAPAKDNLFRAFEACDIKNVRVVLLGQDPYHTPGVANGMAFAVNPGCDIPPSLANMFAELRNSMAYRRFDRTLDRWAKQGVLLLNTTLTVQHHHAHSHANLGWEDFIQQVVQALVQQNTPLVWLLLGSPAKKRLEKFTLPANHRKVIAVHPSPLSAHKGFFGSNCFQRVNEHLIWLGQKPIAWAD